ncbi:MAG: ATP-binding protein, partial [Pirellulales bacterium]
TGVGLSACREIVEAHKGKIQVASTVGKGTAFTLKLPVASTNPTTTAPVALGAPAQTTSPNTNAN